MGASHKMAAREWSRIKQFVCCHNAAVELCRYLERPLPPALYCAVLLPILYSLPPPPSSKRSLFLPHSDGVIVLQMSNKSTGWLIMSCSKHEIQFRFLVHLYIVISLDCRSSATNLEKEAAALLSSMQMKFIYNNDAG